MKCPRATTSRMKTCMTMTIRCMPTMANNARHVMQRVEVFSTDLKFMQFYCSAVIQVD